MSDKQNIPRIAGLSGLLISQIAAGEVIERPASVVKELVENSIDAGAGRIDIDIEAGGCGAILISDDGCGIHPDDVELAVMRHTTSKLRTREDLESIRTMGFRGEALSSIASVSLFRLTSRIEGSEHALCLDIDPVSGRSGLTPAAHPVGTRIEVRNLFYNVPARRKFLRSERTEFLHIVETVRQLVLARPDIHIRLRQNGKTILNSPPVEGDVRARLQTVMGGAFYPNARALDVQGQGMQLHGWIGRPQTARSQSDRQYLYLNRRIIRDRQITHAIRMALEPELPAARYPAYVIYLEIDPALVDVNVHPTKQEVRFRHPREVHDFIYAALREVPGTSARTGVSFPSTGVRAGGQPGAYYPADLRETAADYAALSVEQQTANTQEYPLGRPLAITASNHIVALYGGALRIIDFHQLQSSYLQSRLEIDYAQGAIVARPLLVPVSYSVTTAGHERLPEWCPLLAPFGLQVELIGPQSVMIRSLPALLPELELRDLLDELLRLPPARPGERPETVLVPLLLRHAGLPAANRLPLPEIAASLRRFATGGFAGDEAMLAGCWITLSPERLRDLIEG